MTFSISRNKGEAVHLLISVNYRSTTPVIHLGDLTLTSPGPDYGIENANAGLAVERICRGDLKELSVDGVSSTVAIGNLCDRLISTFSRLYYCLPGP